MCSELEGSGCRKAVMSEPVVPNIAEPSSGSIGKKVSVVSYAGAGMLSGVGVLRLSLTASFTHRNSCLSCSSLYCQRHIVWNILTRPVAGSCYPPDYSGRELLIAIGSFAPD